tara:strand:- start:2759 stop:3829 length:1071 start_codon:yes stop_codon:yes gene_type:complete
MKNRRQILERVPNSIILSTLLMIFLFEIIFYIVVKSDLAFSGFAQGSDADYYDAYALGYTDVAVNIWPEMLRYLNDHGLYSRTIISYLLFFISLFFIPGLVSKLVGLSFKEDQKNYLYIVLLCLIYPTIFFYTFDVYRDVFMVFSFLIGCLVVKRCLNSSSYIGFLLFFIFSLIIGFFLLGLRPYLGYSFLLALFLWKIRFTKKRLSFLAVFYFSALFFVNYLGYLEFLTDYRSSLEEQGGGSTLGLDFSNPLMFMPNLILSILGQFFGLYITNPLAIALLIIETVPICFMIVYIIKNIRLADPFIRFLIIFFVLYGSVWLIGNDNLGTAVRLRIYNYLAIYICFFYMIRTRKSGV